MTLSTFVRVVLAIACTIAFSGVAAAPDDPGDAQAIFAAARNAWAYTSYPRYANYSVSVQYRNGTRMLTRHYDTLQDLRREIVFAHGFSTEEAANPTTPHGVNIGMLGATLNEPEADDPIGPLGLAITYDFGISRSPVNAQVAQLGSQVTAPSGLQVIGRSGKTALTYTVHLIEMLDGGKTYHLRLTPLREPKRYRLREMWIAAGTYITEKILIDGNFSRSPYTGVPWLVTFVQIDGGPYIAQEQAQAPLDFGDAGSLENVTISFDHLVRTSTLPPYGTVGINGGPTEFLTEP